MTESEWLGSTDPMALFQYVYSIRLRSPLGKRRPRRLALEFWRWQAGNLSSESDRNRLLEAVALADTWAETDKPPTIPPHLSSYFVLGKRAWTVARDTMRALSDRMGQDVSPHRNRKLYLLRELWGNPFRMPSIDPYCLAWNDGTVVRLARDMYDREDFATMPILGDALEEAGCADPEVLAHCRSEEPHVRGCWVVDRLLGIE